MIDVRDGWAVAVERGPGWLFVRLNAAPAEGGMPSPLADFVWSLVERHFVYRVVLECDENQPLSNEQILQLVLLQQKLVEHEGALRLCGLSAENQATITQSGLGALFPCYADRDAAVRASRPKQPR